MDALAVRCCLMTSRAVWLRSNHDRYPFGALHWAMLFFQQCWLRLFESHIAPLWAKHCRSSSTCVRLKPLLLGARHRVR